MKNTTISDCPAARSERRSSKTGQADYLRNNALRRTAQVLALLVCLGGVSASAQYLQEPNAVPNLTFSSGAAIYAVASQPDGGLILGGSFSQVNGLNRSNIVRIRTDGSVDPLWNPGANDLVLSLAVDVNGDVFAGGAFSTVGGQPRAAVAKISGSAAGAVDPVWNPGGGFSPGVYALKFASDGSLYVGGFFDFMGGWARNFVARVSPSGSGAADPLWNPDPSNTIRAIALGAGGEVYLGGVFTQIGGQPRKCLAKVSASGSGAVDPTWNPGINYGSSAPFHCGQIGASDIGYVEALAVGSTGAVYAGGRFDTIGGQSRNSLAKLSSSGSGAVDVLWNPAPRFSGDRFPFIRSLQAGSAGELYVGGAFGGIDTSAGPAFNAHLAKVLPSGRAAPDWSTQMAGEVHSIVLGRNRTTLFAGGAFTQAVATPRDKAASLPTEVVIFRNSFD